MTLLRCRVGGLGTKRNSAYLKLWFRVWSVLRHGGGPCQNCQKKRQVKESREEPRVDLKSESEVAQSCPTLWDPVDCSPPGSSVHGSLQARMMEWIAIFFSRGSSRPRDPILQADALISEPPGKPEE